MKALKVKFLTQRQFAFRLGVTPAAVTRWKHQGYLVMTPDELVDVAQSEARLRMRPPVYKGGRAKSLFTPAKPFDLGIRIANVPSLDDAFG